MEGRCDAARGHRAGSNKSAPLFVPVRSSPVSREASRELVALDMWLHTTYQISKIYVCIPGTYQISKIYVCIPGMYCWVLIGWVGYIFLT